MRLRRLSLRDRRLFDRFLRLSPHELSVYAFANIYIWKNLFDIYWVVIEDSLCVFFKDSIGCFLYIPPQGGRIEAGVIEQAFGIMDRFNSNKQISRIENLEADKLAFYQALGYECIYKSSDYLCRRIDLARLRGNRFKSQRACFNYFLKHYHYAYLPFSLRYKDACLRLYDLWARERKHKTQDTVYQGMLGDSRSCLEVLLHDYQDLGLMGRVVKIDKEVKAFTFGFRLNQDTFCILYEIADITLKGLAQYIFQKFCSDLRGYKYINIMDDLGLENLKKVKFSYHPIRLIPNYIIKRRNA
ncbi:MAG: DUF2156 domain-containing protein [Candidatus Omnitrophica bacterium]|nr:DUF2156 domain-containing protein [Candidatus Omnitrophota bacterium]